MTTFHLFILSMTVGVGTLGLGLLANSAKLRRSINNKYRRILGKREMREAIKGKQVQL